MLAVFQENKNQLRKYFIAMYRKCVAKTAPVAYK